MELLEIKKPTAFPNFLNRFKLSLWEAVEVHLDNGVLLCAVCDMGLFGKAVSVFYDKKKRKVFTWEAQTPSKDAVVADNLLNGAETRCEGKKHSVRIVNNFQDGKCHLKGWMEGEPGRIEYEFEMTRLSKPSVVSIPFADPSQRHRPLYSQKDFFKCDGWLKVNDEETMKSTETTSAIVDDHKGYYPRRAHYDWLTTMGVNETDGEKKWFAFNLTRNQSIDQDKYNENNVWLEKEISLLPPVTFTRDIPTIEFKDRAKWTVRDEHDMVNVTFHVHDIFRMILHAMPVVNIEYFIAFGELEGYVRDESGKKYVLDGMVGIGEDKDLVF